MENASKALLMAASVLIGILILSLAVYLFVSFGQASAQLHEQQDQQRLEQFNSQFSSYVGKKGITIHDIITITNLAIENNRHYEFEPRNITAVTGQDNYISVIIKGKTGRSEQLEKYVSNGTGDLTSRLYYLIVYDLNRIDGNTPPKAGEKEANDTYNWIGGTGTTINKNQNDYEEDSDYAVYDCNVEYSSVTGRVYKVIFTAK